MSWYTHVVIQGIITNLHIINDTRIYQNLRVFVVVFGPFFAFFETRDELLEVANENGDREVICSQRRRRRRHLEVGRLV